MLKVRLFTYILFLIFYALLGIMTVNERSGATLARYQLAKTIAAERKLDEQIAREKKLLAILQSPAHLEKLNLEMKLLLQPLRTSLALEKPQPASPKIKK